MPIAEVAKAPGFVVGQPALAGINRIDATSVGRLMQQHPGP